MAIFFEVSKSLNYVFLEVRSLTKRQGLYYSRDAFVLFEMTEQFSK